MDTNSKTVEPSVVPPSNDEYVEEAAINNETETKIVDHSVTRSSGEYDVEAVKEVEGPTREKRTKPFIVLVAFCAALGGLIFGYDIAGAGATFLMDGFNYHFHWKCPPGVDPSCVPATQEEINADQGFINGLFGAGAAVGAILAPWMADKFGRKMCLLAASITFIFGASLQAAAPNMDVMFVGRIFSGGGIGGLSMCAPVYIAEVAPEHTRGMLSTLWQLSITMGILIASAANLGLQNWYQGWRISYGGNIVFAVILIASLFFMPESPRWLTGKGKDEEARKALVKTRYEDEIEWEMEELARECFEEKKLGVATWREIFATGNKLRYRLFLGIGLQAVQQLSGINAIMFYAPTILNKFFGSSQAIIGTFILNTINFLSTFITIYMVEKAGRVKLLVSGGLLMMLALITNAILSSVEPTITVGWLVLVFAAVYIVAFAYSWGPVVWTVCSEMFPLHTRGKATGVTTMTNWIFTTIVGAVFPLASTASLSGCFIFFAVIIFAGSNMVYFFQAETAKKTIIQIDEDFEKHEAKLLRKKW